MLINRKWMKSSEGWLLETSLLEIDGKELYPCKLIYPDGICVTCQMGQENVTGVNLQVLKELPQLQEKERFGQSYMHMEPEKTCYCSVHDRSTCCITYIRWWLG